MSPGPGSGFSPQTAASARTPGRRISSDWVARAWGDEPVVEAGIQGECRQCVEVLIRLVSRWGAAWADSWIPASGAWRGAAEGGSASGAQLFIIRNASVRGRGQAWSDQINHELIQQNFTDHYPTILWSCDKNALAVRSIVSVAKTPDILQLETTPTWYFRKIPIHNSVLCTFHSLSPWKFSSPIKAH